MGYSSDLVVYFHKVCWTGETSAFKKGVVKIETVVAKVTSL